MYVNAEEKRRELDDSNEMNGQMFKVAADPRIIGSGEKIHSVLITVGCPDIVSTAL